MAVSNTHTIYLPKTLAKQIELYLQQHPGLSVSKLVQQALIEKFGK